MKKYTWTLTVTMDETWVEDGFDLTDRRADEMVQAAYPHVNGNEVTCKVISRPPDAEVAKAMGYQSVEKYLNDRDRRGK
jgi:hypothetical protein